ncbi:DUF5652 family protein [Patescibacteria group bacterium]
MENELSDAALAQFGFNIMGWGIGLTLAFILLTIWSVVWKAIALWRAGRNNQLGWFIVLFLINTIGILEILYIFVFQPKENKSEN